MRDSIQRCVCAASKDNDTVGALLLQVCCSRGSKHGSPREAACSLSSAGAEWWPLCTLLWETLGVVCVGRVTGLSCAGGFVGDAESVLEQEVAQCLACGAPVLQAMISLNNYATLRLTGVGAGLPGK